MSRDREMSLMEHLRELRTRLVYAAIAVFVAAVISFIFADRIIRVLMMPAGLIELQTIAPTEGFISYMRVSLFSGIALAMPVILYQAFRYVDPALQSSERRFILVMGLPIMGLFVLGVAFCYFLLLPTVIEFLFTFGGEVFRPDPRASEYLSFVTTFLLAMGVVFEMPPIIFALVKVGVLRREWLARQRRYIFLGCFIVAAVITPPDGYSQIMVGIPMYLLFELGLLFARFAVPRQSVDEAPRPSP